MRSCSVALLVVALGATAEGARRDTEMQRASIVSRARSQALSHSQLHDPVPCQPGFVRVFNPQLTCEHVKSPAEPAGLVVVTEETCHEVLNGIKTKTPPYWDVEESRCAAETRVQLLTQCAQKTANFSSTLQDLCHFNTKMLSVDFHSVKTVESIPAVEIPTGATVPGQDPNQKKTQISISMENAINNYTHQELKTPEHPIDSYADYPTELTQSAQNHAQIAQAINKHLIANAASNNGVVVQGFHYEGQPKPSTSDHPNDPVILGASQQPTYLRSVKPVLTVPAAPIVAAVPSSNTPKEEWARYPALQPTASATISAIHSQQAQGILVKSPTVVTIHKS